MQQKEVEYNRKYYDEWIDTYQTHHLDFDEWQQLKGIKVKEKSIYRQLKKAWFDGPSTDDRLPFF